MDEGNFSFKAVGQKRPKGQGAMSPCGSGPPVDFVGTLWRLVDAGRVRVLLDMMGTAVPVALRHTAICPAA